MKITFCMSISIGFVNYQGEKQIKNIKEVKTNKTKVVTQDSKFAHLTYRQRIIATLLEQGYTRKRLAKKLGLSNQAIHQITGRIIKRLEADGNTLQEPNRWKHSMITQYGNQIS